MVGFHDMFYGPPGGDIVKYTYTLAWNLLTVNAIMVF